MLPGMQAAFVDIGLKKNAFLYIDDVLHPHLEKQPKQKPSISELLTVGQELIVQVMKEPRGGKGRGSLPIFAAWQMHGVHAYCGLCCRLQENWT